MSSPSLGCWIKVHSYSRLLFWICRKLESLNVLVFDKNLVKQIFSFSVWKVSEIHLNSSSPLSSFQFAETRHYFVSIQWIGFTIKSFKDIRFQSPQVWVLAITGADLLSKHAELNAHCTLCYQPLVWLLSWLQRVSTLDLSTILKRGHLIRILIDICGIRSNSGLIYSQLKCIFDIWVLIILRKMIFDINYAFDRTILTMCGPLNSTCTSRFSSNQPHFDQGCTGYSGRFGTCEVDLCPFLKVLSKKPFLHSKGAARWRWRNKIEVWGQSLQTLE